MASSIEPAPQPSPPGGRRRFWLQSLGCKANWSDGQAIEAALGAAGFEPVRAGEIPDLCVINSCSVTDEAHRQSLRLARTLRARYPHTRVALTGCAAQTDPEGAARARGVDFVVGNQDKASLAQMLSVALQGAHPSHGPAHDRAHDSSSSHDSSSDPTRGQILGQARGYDSFASSHALDREWPRELEWGGVLAPTNPSWRTRAFLKVQDGCDRFCTYCVIPYGRGPSRSLPIAEVVARVCDLEHSGVREVVLTGINLGDYEWGVGELVRAILSAASRIRVRVSSLDPEEIMRELMPIWQSALSGSSADAERLCPHAHVALQSPIDATLRRMKRRYRAQQAEQCLEELARLSALRLARGSEPIFVGMDVIAGFPAESDRDFAQSLAWLEAMPWSRLHVFPYSERSGTPATRLALSVPPVQRRIRARALRELSLRRLGEQSEQLEASGVLAHASVLWERPSQGWQAGWSAGYRRFRRRIESDPVFETGALTPPPPGLVRKVSQAQGEWWWESRV